MSDVHPNVSRVVSAAKERGLEINTKRFPEGTKTAADAAAAIGVTVGQIVKSLVFGVDGEIVMALVSGSNQLEVLFTRADSGHLLCHPARIRPQFRHH